MILGIGLDLCEIHRIEKAIARVHFLERVFTPAERGRILSASGSRRGEIAAGLFAAKEAVAKALGTGFDGFGPDAVEILPQQMRGCVVSYIPLLGGFLGWICTLKGVCVCLALGIILLAAMLHIAVGLGKVMRHNRRVKAWDQEPIELIEEEPAEEAEAAEEPAEEPEPDAKEKPQTIGGCTMEQSTDDDGKTVLIFGGESMDVLKLTKVFRSAAEKRGTGSLVMEEQYGEISQLKLTVGEDDLPLVNSVIGMLREREE